MLSQNVYLFFLYLWEIHLIDSQDFCAGNALSASDQIPMRAKGDANCELDNTSRHKKIRWHLDNNRMWPTAWFHHFVV